MSYYNFYQRRLPLILDQIKKLKKTTNGPKYYAVAVGRRTGIFQSWLSVKQQIDGIANAKYRRFYIEKDALKYIEENRKEKIILAQNHNALMDTTKAEICFTDGGCWMNGTPEASAGIGVHWPNHPEKDISLPLEGKQTNIRAEIWAAIVAIRQAHQLGIKNLIIYTDSYFVIKTSVQWLPKWKQNGWRSLTGGELKNRDDLMMLDQTLSLMKKIQWRHVVAHSGVVGNEIADRLANKAIKKHTFLDTTDDNVNDKIQISKKI
ncbi:Ribonuclease H1 [Blomia tropicalis]|nr:Ribonuclease H1 [Blomia tropicalis]